MSAEDNDRKFAKVRAWDSVIHRLLLKPDEKLDCPFCQSTAITYSWSTYSRDPRAASFDARCDKCGEFTHVAVMLPEGSPDNYP